MIDDDTTPVDGAPPLPGDGDAWMRRVLRGILRAQNGNAVMQWRIESKLDLLLRAQRPWYVRLWRWLRAPRSKKP